MKSRENLVRLKKFQVKEKQRQVLQLEMMINDFERMASELTLQIEAEERKAGITDPSHFAYPTFARAARTRRDNMSVSRKELQVQFDAAKLALEEAEAELAKAEALEQRDGRYRSDEQQAAAG